MKDLPLIAITILIYWAIVPHCNAAVDSRFLDAVERIESGGNALAVGDSGRSIGAFQMGLMSWLDVSEVRASKGLKTYPYAYATNSFISRTYAREYCQILRGKLKAQLRREPTSAEIYLAYNCGFTRSKSRGFLLSKSPKSTRLAIQQLNK